MHFSLHELRDMAGTFGGQVYQIETRHSLVLRNKDKF